MLESVFGVYAKNGWHTKAFSCEYMPHPALSAPTAGMGLASKGITVVLVDRGNVLSFSLLAPLGEMKYEHKPKALKSLCISTFSMLVNDRAFLIHS